MLGKVMKSLSIATLLLSFLWCRSAINQVWSVEAGGYLELLDLAVWATAIMVVIQTARDRRFIWAAAFTAIAVLFNPVAPVTLFRQTFLIFDSLCIVAFVLSLALLRTQPVRARGSL